MRGVFLALLLATINILQAQDIMYSPHDSIFVTTLLQKYQKHSMCNGGLVLAIANEFIGNKYVAGTLERGHNEPLVINTREIDCTTFVEQVLAIYATISEEKTDFKAMCTNLQRIRYRGGVRNGYASRLHYISQWITDSAKQHIVEEIDYKSNGREEIIDLNFMSSHPGNYELLKKEILLVKEIRKWEQLMQGTVTHFIPKNELNKPANELPVKNGDIIALTTNIKGLDVTHIGFAFWENGKLHMLHASSTSKKVIKDNNTLYEYQKNKKTQTGIRVFRVK